VVGCDVHLALSSEKEQDQAIYGEAFLRIAKEYQSGLLPSLDEIYMQSDRAVLLSSAAPGTLAFVARFHKIFPGVAVQRDFTADCSKAWSMGRANLTVLDHISRATAIGQR
jgi:hypothetical protein